MPIKQAITADSASHYYFWLHWGQFASSKNEADLEELQNVVNGYYRIPYVNYSWENGPYAKLLLEPRFVEFVDRILAEPNASPPG